MIAFVDKPRALVITGPTSSGKTKVSVELATHLKSEIISLDASQIYKDIPIGTGAPSVDEIKRVRHHLIGIYTPNTRINAAQISDEAFGLVKSFNSVGKLPVIVAGSYMYLKFLIHGYLKDTSPKFAISDISYEKLKVLDPEYAAKISPSDKIRIQRALQFIQLNKKYSEAIKNHNFAELRVKPLILGLIWDRKELYSRIERRCLEMLNQGLIQEVSNAAKLYGPDAWGIKKSIGYKHFLKYLKNELDFDTALRLFVKDTKTFARKQTYYMLHEPIKRGYVVLPKPGDLRGVEINVGDKKVLCYRYRLQDLVNVIEDFEFKKPCIIYLDAKYIFESLDE